MLRQENRIDRILNARAFGAAGELNEWRTRA